MRPASDDTRLVQENRRYRRRAQDAERAAERLRAIVEEQDRLLLGVWLRGVLADPTDFERYVDPASVRGEAGELVWPAVDRAIDDLLAERPYLASPTESPWPRGSRAVDWFTTEG